jgi:hypothetical protein
MSLSSILSQYTVGSVAFGFWIRAHVSLECMLITSISFNWTFTDVRFWLVLAIACHGVMRVCSLAGLIRFPFTLATPGLALLL